MFTGQLTQSLTLIADSFHMLSDASALIVALLAVNYSKRKAHQRLKPWFSRYKYSNTFGWVRFEVNFQKIFLNTNYVVYIVIEIINVLYRWLEL